MKLKPRTAILVTGSAGFIGSNLVKRLLERPEKLRIVGLDNLGGHCDPSLKEYRLRAIEQVAASHSEHDYLFVKGSIADRERVNRLFAEYRFDRVVNLAALPGVRDSIDHPDACMESNVMGFFSILEACRRHPVKHLVFASSSSVYGGNPTVPFRVEDRADTPVSLYAATKRSGELLAYSYSRLYGIPATGLRFFTVYGPAGRPDMAYFAFADKWRRGETVRVFNYGACRRDFTYIDDIVEGVVRVLFGTPGSDRASVPYAIYNLGAGHPENLLDFVQILREELVTAGVLPDDYDFEAHTELVPMQPGDMPETYADTTSLERDFGFTPKVRLRDGLRQFARWYKEFYGPAKPKC